MTLKEAAGLFAGDETIEKARALLKGARNKQVRFYGLAGSSAAMLLYRLGKSREPALIVARDMDSAGYIYHDLAHIGGEESVAFFPSGYKRDIRFGQADPPQQILRTEALDALVNSKALKWVVSYPEALAEKVPPRLDLGENTLLLRSGKKYQLSEVIRRLRELGFREVDYVYEAGQFANRGSILDIYSYSNEFPYRIDFFDDEIDSIRLFNVETQLSMQRLEEVSVLGNDASGKGDGGVSLLEFLDKSSIIWCPSPGFVLSRVEEVADSTFSESASISGEGDAEALKQLVDFEAFRNAWAARRVVEFSAAPQGDMAPVNNGKPSDSSLDFDCSPQMLYHKNFELISESFRNLRSRGYEILLLSDAPYQAQRLREIFKDRGEEIAFTPVDLTLHEGFVDNLRKVCYFTDHQIFDRFHKYSLKSDRARNGKLAMSLKELQMIEKDDFIVHVDHGIGRFGGLVKTDVNGSPQEMIKLFYQNDDILLVSIHALHKLSKYRGKEGVPPRINKLGTGAWSRIKERTKSRVKDIARDLIKIYAARREEKGFAYSPDSYLQAELEASFHYEDTPDQLTATQAIKADMESPRPMDRLICGDVGFGKTELAVRAAFTAATDGKQTAVLVPTTVLAMQHYHTFSRRLKDFPVRVEFISRAKSPKQVREILADLEAGKVDILIGTHKLVGNSVKFKDLGLLIIDEEQKFGVSVKEKLRRMKTQVDTLTMSATPIPRTLQFSLMGARDLSSLNTPPANRHPIVTNVVGLDDDILKEAVNFELSRNGQVFVVSNRIADLEDLETRLRRILPGVRLVVAHGQMPPAEVEKRITDFVNHDYDVLLSTTIIENGIDIPNVNTMIVNNAHRFGLSELHQLRGRVGRSSRKAFCYLMVPPGAHLTPEASRRLAAIESFSDLGSGIHIAMQDLDIRGAGNLLGAEQSGFIADLGYETYQKILREAVIELKTEEFGDTFEDVNAENPDEFVADCTIESDLELRLPPSYIPQESERISLYQQLDNMETAEQTEEFRRQLIDRFGRIPQTAEELIKVVPLRHAAKRLGMERLVLKGGRFYGYFVGKENEAYYHSDAFTKVVNYLMNHIHGTQLREAKGKQSVLIEDVGSVSAALQILTEMLAS